MQYYTKDIKKNLESGTDYDFKSWPLIPPEYYAVPFPSANVWIVLAWKQTAHWRIGEEICGATLMICYIGRIFI